VNQTTSPPHAGPSGRRATGRELRATLRRTGGAPAPGERLGEQLSFSILVRIVPHLNVRRDFAGTPCGRAHTSVVEPGFPARRTHGLREERSDHDAVPARFGDGPASAGERTLREPPGSDTAPDR
jgi:hypothetical protein